MFSKIISFIMSIVMAVLGFFGIGCGKGEAPKPVEYSADGRSVSIALTENGTTGYRWKCKINDENIVGLSGDKFINTADPMLMGAPGTRVFTFTSKTVGKTTVELSYLREWENIPIETVTVEIEVQSDMTLKAEIKE